MKSRNQVIAKVHALAKVLGFDDTAYRTVLLTHTGRTSCKEMTDEQLGHLADALACLAEGKAVPVPGARPANRHKALGIGQPLPTSKQWEVLEALAHRSGWIGLDDFRMLAFARHTAKVADLGELTRAGMSKIITGLTRRLSQQTSEVTK